MSTPRRGQVGINVARGTIAAFHGVFEMNELGRLVNTEDAVQEFRPKSGSPLLFIAGLAEPFVGESCGS